MTVVPDPQPGPSGLYKPGPPSPRGVAVDKKAGARRSVKRRSRSPPSPELTPPSPPKKKKEEEKKEDKEKEAGKKRQEDKRETRKRKRRESPVPSPPSVSRRNGPRSPTASPNRKKMKGRHRRPSEGKAETPPSPPPESEAASPLETSEPADTPTTPAPESAAGPSGQQKGISATKKKGLIRQMKASAQRRRRRSPSPVLQRLLKRLHVEDVPVNTVIAQGHVGGISYTVRKVRDRRYKKLAVDQANFDIKFQLLNKKRKNKQLLKDSYLAVEKALKLVHNFLINEYKDSPYTGLQLALQHEGLEKGAITMPVLPLNDLGAVEDLMYALQNVNQSNQSLALDDSMKISAIVNRVAPLRSEEEQKRKEEQEAKRRSRRSGGAGFKIGAAGAASPNEPSPKRKKKRGRPCKKEEDQVMLGPEFRKSLYTSNKDSMKMVPEIAAGPLRDCCLLLAIVLGLKHAEEMAEHAHQDTVGKFPTSPSWRKLSQCWRKDKARAKSACRFLEEETLRFCEEHDIDPAKFRLVDPEDVRTEIRKMPLNLLIYNYDCNLEVVFQEPYVCDPTKPTVSVLKRTNPVTQLDHAGVITRPDRFFSSKGRQRCLDCKETFVKR